MQVVAGAPVTGEDFYKGRLNSVEDLRTRLSKKDVLVTGPRRTGKTSVVLEYQRLEKTQGKHVIFIDLEKIQSIYEYYFVVTSSILTECQKYKLIANKAIDHFKLTCNRFAEIFPDGIDFNSLLGSPQSFPMRVKIPKFKTEDDSQQLQKLSTNLSELLKNINVELIIFLDEFPELIWKFGKTEPLAEQNNVRKTQTQFLLEGLRAIRQEQVGRKHKTIIAGSINLANTLKHLGLTNIINDLDRLEIPYLTPDSSSDLVNGLIVGHHFKIWSENEFKQFIIENFGFCSPFYLQLFSERLIQHELNRGGQKDFSLADIQLCYKETLTNDRGPAYFRERLKKYYENHSKVAEAILAIVSADQFQKNKHPTDSDVFTKIQSVQALTRPEYTELLAKMLCDDLVTNLEGGDSLGFESQFLCNFWHYSLVGSEFLKK